MVHKNSTILCCDRQYVKGIGDWVWETWGGGENFTPSPQSPVAERGK
ncbi:hypothetical protein [Nostoc sp. C117]